MKTQEIASYTKTVSQPVISNGQVVNFQSQRILRNQGSLDPDGDNNPLAQEFKNVSQTYILNTGQMMIPKWFSQWLV